MNLFNVNTVPKVACIYSITNIENNLFYIGSTIDARIRWRGHINTMKHGNHHNKRIQNDFNKFGIDAFVFDMIEIVEKKKEVMISREQWYLDFFRPHYNILPKADSRMGTKMSNEAKEKLRIYATGRKRSPEANAKIVAAQTGRKLTDKQRARRKELMKDVVFPKRAGTENPYYGKKHTDEMKTKMRNGKTSQKSKDALDKTHKYLKDSGIFAGNKNPFYNKKHSEASIEKIRAAAIKQHQNKTTKN